MSLVRSEVFGRGLLALMMWLGISGMAWGAIITNGNFSSSTYTVNTEFDTTFNPNNTKGSVTGWTSTGYSIYFIGGTQTTVSATGQWTSSGKEMLDAASTKLSPDGGNFIGMDADPSAGLASTASTTMTGLTIGQYYSISFYWAASQLQSRTGATNEQVGVQVLNGATMDLNHLTSVVQNPTAGFTIDTVTGQWFKETVLFRASATTETLKFLAKSTSTCLPPMVLLDGVSVNVAVPEPATLTMLGAGVLLIGIASIRRRGNKKPAAQAIDSQKI